MPVVINEQETRGLLSSCFITFPVSEIESVQSRGEKFRMSLPQPYENALRELDGDDAVAYSHQIGVHCLVAILDSVRNRVLEWALNLERQGITGEGRTFSVEEQASAQNNTFNIFGNVSDSQFQQASNQSSQDYTKGLDLNAVQVIVNSLTSSINDLELGPKEENELKDLLDDISSQLNSQKPDEGVVRKSLASVRRVLEGAVGSSLGQGIISLITPLIT